MKLISIHKGHRNGLRKNRKGGIEGLPLQLMIIIMIATLGTAIIIGWMGNIETPNSIGEVNVESGDIVMSTDSSASYRSTTNGIDTVLKSNGINAPGYHSLTKNIVISVYDQDGNPLKDATVVLTGLGIVTMDGSTVHGTTDQNGTVTFNDARVRMNGTVGFINVEVSKAGYGEDSSCRITVVA